MKGGIQMSNRSLWMLVAVLILVIIFLFLNSTFFLGAPKVAAPAKAVVPGMKEGMKEGAAPMKKHVNKPKKQ
jgi:hypothetical protein